MRHTFYIFKVAAHIGAEQIDRDDEYVIARSEDEARLNIQELYAGVVIESCQIQPRTKRTLDIVCTEHDVAVFERIAQGHVKAAQKLREFNAALTPEEKSERSKRISEGQKKRWERIRGALGSADANKPPGVV